MTNARSQRSAAERYGINDDKLREALTVQVEEAGALKIGTQDNAAVQTQHSADMRNLAAGIATTRRALDPEALGSSLGLNQTSRPVR